MFKYLGTGTDEFSLRQARINKTNYFWNNKNGFLCELSKEIELLKKRAAREFQMVAQVRSQWTVIWL
jgi:hypothetical protein